MPKTVATSAAVDPTQPRTFIAGRSPVRIGRFTYGTEHMQIRQWREGAALEFGSFCSIAVGLTVLLGGNHRTDWATTFPFGHIFRDQLGGEEIVGHPQSRGDVIIGNDVWIGQNVTILSGLRIGDGAVIAANATVVKDVGAYEIWGGNPARLVRPRFDAEVAARIRALRWWDRDIGLIRRLAPLLSQVPDEDVLRRMEAMVAAAD
ncbi:CatB-related O-acetyltransferase [Frigidibacter sp. MR17.14]|uniref:CatB-related O-acetyltransferase n=1 Tax=Frigidibacter sp. MR17.14 TaxID=3126509 RepID=UPI003012F1FB